ncbi:hypothetical protein [Endozoicomonas ascidiicola]|uniref:hypothetical protein n=1 Tax=Endozoicomonas ascidiicola TaxID=1698521 RepID=UPI000832B2DF|nr:hypothetical protein [Endozoicomonas ascidiicola]
MELFNKMTAALVRSADGNPVHTTLTVMLFFVMFSVLEATIEKLIFGERFEHWLDPIFICGFIGFASYMVWVCAVYKESRTSGS